MLWQFIDALCTGVLEVLAILAWYGVYSYVVEDLPDTSKVSHMKMTGTEVITGYLDC